MTRRNLRTITSCLSGAALALALGACAQGPTDQVPEPAQSAAEGLSPAAEPAKPPSEKPEGQRPEHCGPRAGAGGHPGPGFLLHAALEELDLTADQQTNIEALEKELDSARPFDSEAHRSFDKALAGQIRAGKVDANALSASLTGLEQDAVEGAKRMHGALNKLHALLTAEQRQALVKALQAQPHPGMGPGPGFGPPEPGDEPPPERVKRHGFRGHGPEGMFRDLDLSDAQREKLDAVREQRRGDRDAMMARGKDRAEKHQALLRAFAGNDFDANRLVPEADIRKMAREHALERTKHLEPLVGVLEPEQRAKLAARIESGPRGPKH